ncbi:MAG: hypothetical protein FWE98_03840 [Oscillospiraceae bacterium]|nr:hypothetical protein [Oscillospiraceae bacterium]
MKRIAMALAAAMLLGLCACGQEAAPVTLSVVRQDWTGRPVQQMEPISLGAYALKKRSVAESETWDGNAKITLKKFDDNTVTVRFQTKNMVERNPNGTINLMSDEHDWVAVIPYEEPYEIITQTMDAGTSFIYTFSKNNF